MCSCAVRVCRKRAREIPDSTRFSHNPRGRGRPECPRESRTSRTADHRAGMPWPLRTQLVVYRRHDTVRNLFVMIVIPILY